MHGCMPGRISVQNTARCTVPRPLFLHSMHARQSARTIIVRRNAGRLLFHPCRACTNGFTACASKGGISPCLVRPPARLVLALLQHARVSACPGSALLGTAAMRALHGAARSRDGRLRALHRVRSALPVPSLQILHQRQHACMAACPGAELPRTQHAVLSLITPEASVLAQHARTAISAHDHRTKKCGASAVPPMQSMHRRLALPKAESARVWSVPQPVLCWRCCSTHVWQHARAQHCSGQLQCAPAMEQPAPAMDGCNPRPRRTAAPRALDGRSLGPR